MVVGEIFLGAFLQVLFQQLMSPELINFVRSRKGIDKKLKKLSKTLKTIQAVLWDAEDKQLTNESVKIWLDDLRDLTYDMEDVLDKFFTELLRRKIENLNRASSSQIWSFIPACCTKPSSSAFGLFMIKMNSEINEITSRFQDITERKNDLGLNNIGTSVNEWKRPPSSCLPDCDVVGRDEDKKKIINLLREQQSNLNFEVVGIVGMPGVGKTTLAGLVYNDDSVKHFDIKVWVCVSNDFDCGRLTRAILESSDVNEEFSKVQERLKTKLTGQKFLIILDDVWNTKNDQEDLHGLWVKLRSPFRSGAPGSKIIVTTREKHVAELMGAIQPHIMGCVSDDDCWNIFVQHAFFTRNTTHEQQNLGSLREKIIARCKGLPLAARTLGGLFQCKEINEWEDILNDKLWTLSDQGNILSVLRLSYYHLPSYLKRCFAYCCILPEDYEFEEEQLILLWMAEGLIQQPERSKQMEDLGKEYFGELLSRSFFQKSRKDESKYVMHDLINDFAQKVAGETMFKLEDKMDGDNQCQIFEKARHSSYIKGYCDGIQRLDVFSKLKRLRTFLPLDRSHSECYLTSKFTLDVLPKLQYLKVLSLKRYRVTKLPDSIGELKLLRYLDLSYTKIKSLPELISGLYNLQTLLLEGCEYLEKLPKGMKNLTNLRHLNNSNVRSLKGMPLDLGKLTNLQTLPEFVVGKDSGSSGVGELGFLLHLHGRLSISGLENVNGARDAIMAKLAGKNGIDVLLLIWEEGKTTDQQVLEVLMPHRMLKEFTVNGYGGSKFPAWVGDPSIFSKMVRMVLKDCKGCSVLPPLGKLVSLKELIIEEMCGIERIGSEFYGVGSLNPFPSLEILKFSNMNNWEEWSQIKPKDGNEGFPQLKKLFLKGCPKLKGKLPKCVPSLEKLQVNTCEELVVSIHAEGLVRLKHLEVYHCKGVSDELQQLTCLEYFKIENISVLHYTEAGEEATGEVELHLPTKVQTLELGNINNSLVKVPKGLHLSSIQELCIYGCQNLTCLPESGLPSSLRVLRIEKCQNLKSLVMEDANSNSNLNVVCLESLEIRSCGSFESLSLANDNLPIGFTKLRISWCDAIQCLSSGKLPATLRNLNIQNCKSLIWLSSKGELPKALESIYILRCGMLKCIVISKGKLPKALKSLEINQCRQLEWIADKFDDNTNTCLEYVELELCKSIRSLPEGLHHLINLSQLRILRCENLVCCGGLPASSKLTHLSVNGNPKMVVAEDPNKGICLLQNLNSLKVLKISYNEGLMRVFEQYGFLPNLTRLHIYDLKECIPLFQMELLHRLTSLRILHLEGEARDIVSFPPEPPQQQQQQGRMATMMLPDSLIQLHIGNFKNLERLSSGFQYLTSLQCLWLFNCKKLKSLPVGGLPLSLLKFYINGCPLLKKQCERDEVSLCPLISHIPCVEFDNSLSFLIFR